MICTYIGVPHIRVKNVLNLVNRKFIEKNTATAERNKNIYVQALSFSLSEDGRHWRQIKGRQELGIRVTVNSRKT